MHHSRLKKISCLGHRTEIRLGFCAYKNDWLTFCKFLSWEYINWSLLYCGNRMNLGLQIGRFYQKWYIVAFHWNAICTILIYIMWTLRFTVKSYQQQSTPLCKICMASCNPMFCFWSTFPSLLFPSSIAASQNPVILLFIYDFGCTIWLYIVQDSLQYWLIR